MRLFEHVGRLGLVLGLGVFGACGDGGSGAQVSDVTDISSSDVDTGPDSTEDVVSSECTFATLPSAPTTEPASVRFSLNRDTVLDRHLFIPTPEDLEKGGYGGGGALIDYNDDGLIDVLLARRAPEGSPTCLYENTSTATHTTFREAACFPEFGKTGGARVGDFDGDSKEELLVYGDDNLHLLDGPDLAQAELIFTRDPSANPCLIRTAIAHPSEQDKLILFFGELDDPSNESLINLCRPIVLRRNDGGEYSTIGPWEQADFEPNVLAVGRSDVDDDGLLDTTLVVDTFSNEDKKNTGAHPGGIVRGVLAFEPEPLGFVPWVINSNRAWGSFMGINELLVGSAPATFVSDLGIPLIRTNATGDDLASLLPATATGDPQPYSWSPIVADFNLDQRDDIVLTRGTVINNSGAASEESDIFLVQTENGFDDRTSSSGLLEHPDAFPDRTDRLHYSRAGAVTDFDRDGKLELIIMPLEGRPLLYESNLATHCLAEINTSYTRPANELYGWAWLDHRGNAHALRVDGHMRLGQPELVPLPIGRGVVRGPSGARISYTCEAGERIAISEPRWAEVKDGSVHLDFCAASLEGQLVQRRAARDNSWEPVFGDAQSQATFPVQDGPQLIRINGKLALICDADGSCAR